LVEFPRLQIVDLSNNSLKGKLPLEYFRNWIAMKNSRNVHLIYMQANTSFQTSHITMNDKYEHSMTMTNKGVMRLYEKIQDSLTAIDLSSNGFEGGIPEVLILREQSILLNIEAVKPNNGEILISPLLREQSILLNIEAALYDHISYFYHERVYNEEALKILVVKLDQLKCYFFFICG
jgi:hypothetical protein